MGAVKNVINAADAAGKMTSDLKETIQLLEEVANNKSEIMESDVYELIRTAGTPENPTVPVDIITSSKRYVHAYTSTGAKIGETVKNSLNNFVGTGKTNILDGVGNLLDNALNVLLGTGVSQVGGFQDYYLIPSKYGITRVDVSVWYRNVQSSSLTEYMEKVIAGVAVKSIADLTKVSLFSFLELYQSQLRVMGLSNSDIEDEVTEAEETYKRITGLLGANSAVSIMSVAPASNSIL